MLPFNQGSIRDYSKRKQNETLIGSNKKGSNKSSANDKINLNTRKQFSRKHVIKNPHDIRGA